MKIAKENILMRMDALKTSLAAAEIELSNLRSAIGVDVFTDPITQGKLFDLHSKILEISARLSIYATMPQGDATDYEKYFKDKSNLLNLMLAGSFPARGFSTAQELIHSAEIMAGQSEARIWTAIF